jgi:hypothetical protein
MLPGAPSQLPPSVSLPAVLILARPGEQLGAWVRGAGHRLALRAGGRSLLIGADLGALLRRCTRVAVRQGQHVVAHEARHLIAWRTLRVVTGTPFLPGLERLRALFPELCARESRLWLPIGLGGPEEALSACTAARIPVLSSRIDYRR